MAVSYSSRKCDSCGGSMDYNRSEKVWVCRYCGQKVVREEKYDGLFTIKNVARQVILNVAYRRMDGARSDLAECEKIDSSYVGTIIARICYNFAALITPQGCRETERKATLQRLKSDYERLASRDDGIAEDEETFYEFIGESDDSDDANAVLLMTFDTLGDKKRGELALQSLDAGKIYSREINKDLLPWCLKNDKMDLAKQVVANKGNIEPHTAMLTVLSKATDGDNKREMIRLLLEQKALTQEDRTTVKNYLCGDDSCQTKATLISAGFSLGFLPPINTVIERVLAPADPDSLRLALQGVCSPSIHDSDLYELMGYALNEDVEKSKIILDAISASGRYVALNSKMITQVFRSPRRSSEERMQLWQSMKDFKADPRALSVAFADVLCTCSDSPEVREGLLRELLHSVPAVSASTLEKYLLECTYDGENKAAIVKMLLELPDARPGQYGDLLGKYLARSPDSPQARAAVVDVMIGAGMPISGSAVTDLICSDSMPTDKKMEMLRRLEDNGSRPRSDALSVYLERCGGNCDYTLINYLYRVSTGISPEAIRNFVLGGSSASTGKVAAAQRLADKLSLPFGSSSCTVTFCGEHIRCSLLQAYCILAPDPYDVGTQMVRAMSSVSRMGQNIEVNGGSVRFKKYLKDRRGQLSPVADRLCDEQKLFSLF